MSVDHGKSYIVGKLRPKAFRFLFEGVQKISDGGGRGGGVKILFLEKD